MAILRSLQNKENHEGYFAAEKLVLNSAYLTKRDEGHALGLVGCLVLLKDALNHFTKPTILILH